MTDLPTRTKGMCHTQPLCSTRTRPKPLKLSGSPFEYHLGREVIDKPYLGNVHAIQVSPDTLTVPRIIINLKRLINDRYDTCPVNTSTK